MAELFENANEDASISTEIQESTGGSTQASASTSGMRNVEAGFLNEVEVTATVELGRAVMPIRDVLKLRRGSVVELDKLVGQPADLLINNTLMAKGEVIVINERFGFRITKFNKPSEP